MNHAEVPLVAVVILTWNQRNLTLECLESLKSLQYPAERLNTILVDNGSCDGTTEAVRSLFPQVVVLENSDNLGFAEGNNVGISYALEYPADYVMLLNNDTVVDNVMLAEMVAVMQQYPDVGIVGPKMLYFDDPERIWCAGNRIDWLLGSSIRLQADEQDKAIPNDMPVVVDFITACGILLRREALEQVGLLDPRFFIYYEETDLCMRTWRAGWRILYVPSARLWHKISAAMGPTSPATDYYMNRNVLLFLAKNRHGIAGWFSVCVAACRNLLAVAAYTVKPHGGARIPNRNARLFALRDALVGRWGKMGRDVAKVCYPVS